MDKKRIKIIFGIVLSILIIGAGSFAGYVYWKKYGQKAEGSEGDYLKSKIVYLKDDRVRVLDENYEIESEVRTVNKYTKFKVVNSNFMVLTSEDGNIAIVDSSKLNAIKVTDEQKKLEKSGHRHIFVMDNNIVGVLSDNGIYSEEKDDSKKIYGREIIKAVKDSEMKFYKISEKGKISDITFEEIKPLVKSGKYITLDSKEFLLYFNKESGNKIENIIEKSNIKNNYFSEAKDNKIKIYDISGAKYPKKIFETDIDKNSFGIIENGNIVEVTRNESEAVFKQFEFEKGKKLLEVKSEVKGTAISDIEILKIMDNKLFFKSVDGMGINTELNFVDFEDIEAGIQNISSIDDEDIKYIAKRGENIYMFSEGSSLFEIDLSRRKVESGKSAYEKKYKTKYVNSFVKSNKNELYTGYSDNKKLYIEKNDFNKKSEFIEIEGITVNSVELYLKQIEENPQGEKIVLWNKELSNAQEDTGYTTIISKINDKNKKINIEDIKGLEYSKLGKSATSNIVYDKGKIYYTVENIIEEVSMTTEESITVEDAITEDANEEEESESINTEENKKPIMFFLYVADENFNILEKYEIATDYPAEYILKNEDKIYMIGKSGLTIFDISRKEITDGSINLANDSEVELSLIKTKNKIFIFEKKELWVEEKWQSTGRVYEIDKNSGDEIQHYDLEGKSVKQIIAYEDKIVVSDGKYIKVYTEDFKPVDKILLKEEIDFMEISGCRVYAAGRYMPLAEVNLETSEIMTEEYIPNLADADYINLIFTE